MIDLPLFTWSMHDKRNGKRKSAPLIREEARDGNSPRSISRSPLACILEKASESNYLFPVILRRVAGSSILSWCCQDLLGIHCNGIALANTDPRA